VSRDVHFTVHSALNATTGPDTPGPGLCAGDKGCLFEYATSLDNRTICHQLENGTWTREDCFERTSPIPEGTSDEQTGDSSSKEGPVPLAGEIIPSPTPDVVWMDIEESERPPVPIWIVLFTILLFLALALVMARTAQELNEKEGT